MSKGSHPRPFSVPYGKYADNWDNIFRKDKHEKESNKKKTSSSKANRGSRNLGAR
jgi:hypothetical protein